MTNLMKFTYMGMVAVCGLSIIADLIMNNGFDMWKLSTFLWVMIAYLNDKPQTNTNETSRSESTPNN